MTFIVISTAVLMILCHVVLLLIEYLGDRRD